MDFIERALGLSPDGGSGSLELLLLAVLSAFVAHVALRRRRAGAGAPDGARHDALGPRP
jgi:hypothetical protein